MFEPIDIVITDPRKFEGDPYEVAAHAVAQAEGALAAVEKAVAVAFLMARNADMERNLALRLPPAGSEYAAGPQGRQWESIQNSLEDARHRLKGLRKAVAFDPRNPAKT